MCIRDSQHAAKPIRYIYVAWGLIRIDGKFLLHHREDIARCLLYTSDAADERSSVDLGGRRIIKKKNNEVRQAQWASQAKKQQIIHT